MQVLTYMQFLAARSRWINLFDARYCIPFAISPHILKSTFSDKPCKINIPLWTYIRTYAPSGVVRLNELLNVIVKQLIVLIDFISNNVGIANTDG